MFGVIGYVDRQLARLAGGAAHVLQRRGVLGCTAEAAAGALVKNIQLFLIAEFFILIVAMVLAVMRSLPGPAFFPFRLMAVVYIDLFRGVPSILVIFLIGFGIPALQLPGVTNDAFVLGSDHAGHRLVGVRRRGLSRGHRGCPSVAGGGRSVARSVARSRGCATSFCRRPCAR